MAERPAVLAPHFDSLEQQREATTLGMWIFLITELMLFGGLFTMYAAYRSTYPDVFIEGSRHLDVTLGSINTGVLIVSSLMMALAVHSAQRGKRNLVVAFLALTALLGATFLAIKAVEYYHHFEEHLIPGVTFAYPGPRPQQAALFFLLYFAMTGVHAIHLIIGIGIVTLVLVRAWLKRFSTEYYTPVELAGLYWHFVDIIWIFLFPLLYLIGRH